MVLRGPRPLAFFEGREGESHLNQKIKTKRPFLKIPSLVDTVVKSPNFTYSTQNIRIISLFSKNLQLRTHLLVLPLQACTGLRLPLTAERTRQS